MKYPIRLFMTLGATMVVAATAAALALASNTTSGARVHIAKTRLGQILVDSKGITLYDFVEDKGKTSVCYGACAALWPPLLTHGKPVAGSGVRASLLGTTKRRPPRSVMAPPSGVCQPLGQPFPVEKSWSGGIQ